MPDFAPVRAGGGRFRWRRRAGPARRRAVAAGFAVVAVVLALFAPRITGQEPATRAVAPAPERPRPPAEPVLAPVRIADAATVRLLRSGDRVDVVAAHGSGSRVLAAGARVAEVPEPGEGEAVEHDGALVVLSVPRTTAVRLAGAGEASRLAVTLRQPR